jgi:hypothetical protein
MRKAQSPQLEYIGKVIVLVIVVLIVAVKVIPLVAGAALLFFYLFRKQM